LSLEIGSLCSPSANLTIQATTFSARNYIFGYYQKLRLTKRFLHRLQKTSSHLSRSNIFLWHHTRTKNNETLQQGWWTTNLLEEQFKIIPVADVG